jgi:hypothetical protein
MAITSVSPDMTVMIQVHDSNPAGLAWTKLDPKRRNLVVTSVLCSQLKGTVTPLSVDCFIFHSRDSTSSNCEIQMSGLLNSNSAPGFTGKNLHDVIQLQNLDSQQWKAFNSGFSHRKVQIGGQAWKNLNRT